RPFRLHRSMIRLLQHGQDARFVGPALRMLSSADLNHRPFLVSALKRLLPQLRPHHLRQWTKEQKTALLNLLYAWYADVELTLCVLKALEEVGDKEAMGVVKPLAEMALTPQEEAQRAAFLEPDTTTYFSEPGLASEDVKRVQRAAAECLAILE